MVEIDHPEPHNKKIKVSYLDPQHWVPGTSKVGSASIYQTNLFIWVCINPHYGRLPGTGSACRIRIQNVTGTRCGTWSEHLAAGLWSVDPLGSAFIFPPGLGIRIRTFFK